MLGSYFLPVANPFKEQGPVSRGFAHLNFN